MKKIAALLLLVLVAAAAATPAFAGKKKVQKVEGQVALPMYAEGSGLQCVFRAERTLAGTVGEPARGLVGYHFDLDPKTIGKNFVLKVTGGGDDVDLDIAFYAAYIDPADPANAPANTAFENREAGGEAGVVPAGFEKVIVCMAAGSDATFMYTAGKGVKLP